MVFVLFESIAVDNDLDLQAWQSVDDCHVTNLALEMVNMRCVMVNVVRLVAVAFQNEGRVDGADDFINEVSISLF